MELSSALGATGFIALMTAVVSIVTGRIVFDAGDSTSRIVGVALMVLAGLLSLTSVCFYLASIWIQVG